MYIRMYYVYTLVIILQKGLGIEMLANLVIVICTVFVAKIMNLLYTIYSYQVIIMRCKFSWFSEMASQLRKVYSKLMCKVWLWVTIIGRILHEHNKLGDYVKIISLKSMLKIICWTAGIRTNSYREWIILIVSFSLTNKHLRY